MKKLITLLSFAVAVGLSGCTWFKPPAVDPIPPHYERVPDALTQDCPVEPPPSKDVYFGFTDWQDKEHLLMEIIQKEITNLSNCNVTKQKLREWDQKQYDLNQSPITPAPDVRSENNAGRYSAWYS